jgi:hypothetical protein
MQGKRRIINSSFLSSLWHKIVNYLEWKIIKKDVAKLQNMHNITILFF